MDENEPSFNSELAIEINETDTETTNYESLMPVINSIDNEQLYNEIIQKLVYMKPEFTYYICKICKKNPLLIFDNDFLYKLDEFKYTCDCQKNEYRKIKIENFQEHFREEYKEENDDEDDFQNFVRCKKKHKFSGYFENSKKNICIKCMKVKDNNNNEGKYIIFDDYSMYKRIKYLISIFKLYNKDNISEDKNKIKEKIEKKEKIKAFITELIQNYINFKNYNIYQTLINLEVSIKELAHKSSEDNLFIYNIQIMNTNDFRNILDDKNLMNYVTKIDLQRKNINNLGLLSNFKNLNHLDIRSNCIVDTRPLINAPFENLEFLNLSSNKIGDDIIENLKSFKFKNLKYLNLDMNYITDYAFFFALSENKNFGNLEKLYLKYNVFSRLFNKNIKTIKNKEFEDYFAKAHLDFNSIQIFGLSNGVFNQKSIEYIFPCFELNNIRIINLKYNNLINFDFLFICQWFLQLEIDINDNKKPKVEQIQLKDGNYNIKQILDNLLILKEHAEEIRLLESFIY